MTEGAETAVRRPGSWVFETLWDACGRVPFSLRLNVVDTVFVSRGVPTMWLRTGEDGTLVQGALPVRPSGGGGIKWVRSCADAIESGFRWSIERSGGELSDDSGFALVWYRSGSREVLSGSEFHRLVREPVWLERVAALQARLGVRSAHIGAYEREQTRVGPRLVPAALLLGDDATLNALLSARADEEAVREAVDGVTKRCAKALQRCFAEEEEEEEDFEEVLDAGFSGDRPWNWRGGDRGGGEEEDDDGKSVESGLERYEMPKSRVRLLRLVLHFVVDARDGRLWLSHAQDAVTQNLIRPVPPRVEMDAATAGSLAAEEVTRAADAVERALRDITKDAISRGMTLADVWSHFDQDGRGFCDEEDFLQGLRKLDMELHPAAEKVLLARILRDATGAIGFQQFSTLVRGAASSTSTHRPMIVDGAVEEGDETTTADFRSDPVPPAKAALEKTQEERYRRGLNNDPSFLSGDGSESASSKKQFSGGDGTLSSSSKKQFSGGDGKLSSTTEKQFSGTLSSSSKKLSSSNQRYRHEDQRIKFGADVWRGAEITVPHQGPPHPEDPHAGPAPGSPPAEDLEDVMGAAFDYLEKKDARDRFVAERRAEKLGSDGVVAGRRRRARAAQMAADSKTNPPLVATQLAVERDILRTQSSAVQKSTSSSATHLPPSIPNMRPTDIADELLAANRAQSKATKKFRRRKPTASKSDRLVSAAYGGGGGNLLGVVEPPKSPLGLDSRSLPSWAQSSTRRDGDALVHSLPDSVLRAAERDVAARHGGGGVVGKRRKSAVETAVSGFSDKARELQEDVAVLRSSMQISERASRGNSGGGVFSDSVEAGPPIIDDGEEAEELEKQYQRAARRAGTHDDGLPPGMPGLDNEALDLDIRARDRGGRGGVATGPGVLVGAKDAGAAYVPQLRTAGAAAEQPMRKPIPYDVHWYDEDTSLLFAVVHGPAGVVTPEGMCFHDPRGLSGAGGQFSGGGGQFSGGGGGKFSGGGGGDASATTTSKYTTTSSKHTTSSKYTSSSQKSPYASGRPVDVLYVPDWCEDLSSVARELEKVLSRLPGSRALVVHLPGMAGTTWNEEPEGVDAARLALETGRHSLVYDLLTRSDGAGASLLRPGESHPLRTGHTMARAPGGGRVARPLTSDFLSVALLHLLRRLRREGRWGPDGVQDPRTDAFAKTRGRIGRDVILVGSGLGAHVAATFALNFVTPPAASVKGWPGTGGGQDEILASAVRGLVLLNGYVHVDKPLRIVWERIAMAHGPLAALAGLGRSLPPADAATAMAIPKAAPASAAALQERERLFRERLGIRFNRTFYTDDPNSSQTIDETADAQSVASSHRPLSVASHQRERPVSPGGMWSNIASAPTKPPAGSEDDVSTLLRNRPVRAVAVRSMVRLLLGSTYVQTLGERLAVREFLARNVPLAQGDPYLDAGIAALAGAASKGKDLRSEIRRCALPVLLVAGAEDRCVVPLHSYNVARARSLAMGGKGVVNGEDSLGDSFANFLNVIGVPLTPRRKAVFSEEADKQRNKEGGLDSARANDGEKEEEEDGKETDALSKAHSAKMARSEEVREDDGMEVSERRRVGFVESITEEDFGLYEPLGSDAAKFVRCPTHVVWLKAGHSVWQERSRFLGRILSSVAAGQLTERPLTPRPYNSLEDLEEEEEEDVSGDGRRRGRSGIMKKKSKTTKGGEVARHPSEDDPSSKEAKRVYDGYTAVLDNMSTAKNPKLYQRSAGMDSTASSSLFESTAGGGSYLGGGGSSGIVPVDSALSGPSLSDSLPPLPMDAEPLQGRARLVAELGRRGLSTEGTEFELLTRLEEVLERETETARDRADKVRRDRRARLQKQKRFEMELKERKERERQLEADVPLEIREARALADEERLRAERERAWRERVGMELEDELARAVEKDRAQQIAKARATGDVKEMLADRKSERKAKLIAKVTEGAGEEGDEKTMEDRTGDRTEALKRLRQLRSVKSMRSLLARQRAANRTIPLRGEELGYGLGTRDARAVVAGAERLVRHVREMRVRNRGMQRRWTRLDQAVASLEAEIARRERELAGVERAQDAAKTERAALIVAMDAAGGPDHATHQERDMLHTVVAELDELSAYRDQQKQHADRIREQLELSTNELAELAAAASIVNNTSRRKEQELMELRLHMSRLVRDARAIRRDALADQDKAMERTQILSRRLVVARTRQKELRKELKRVKKIKRTWVDTAVWQGGRQQRIRKEELIEYAKKELERLDAQLAEDVEELRVVRSRGEECDAEASRSNEDVTLLTAHLRRVVECVRENPAPPRDLQGSSKAAQAAGLSAPDRDEVDEEISKVQDQPIPKSTVYGPILSPEDESLQWKQHYTAKMQELDYYIDEMRLGGERLSSFGIIHGWQIEAPYSVADAPLLAKDDEEEEKDNIKGRKRVLSRASSAPSVTSDGTGTGSKLGTGRSGKFGHSREESSEEDHGSRGRLDSARTHDSDSKMHRLPSSPDVMKKPPKKAERRSRIVPADESKLAAVTRWKPAVERTSEEKRWVAMDRVAFPKLYTDVPEEDKRAYKLDLTYRTDLTRGMIQRLLQLPCGLGMALAFLSTDEQVRAHALITKFSHGFGEDSERARDLESGARAHAAAAIARGYAARIKPPEARTEEEKEWVALDSVFRPDLYPHRSHPQTGGYARVVEERDYGVHVQEDRGRSAGSQRSGSRKSGVGGAESERPMSGASSLSRPGTGVSRPGTGMSGIRMQGGGARDPQDVTMLGSRLSQHRERQISTADAARRRRAVQEQEDVLAEGIEDDEEADELGGVAARTMTTVEDVVRRRQIVRAPGGQPSRFSRADLQRILESRPCDLRLPSERRAQLLLATYGSDGGRLVFLWARSAPSAVVSGLGEIAEAAEMVSEQLRRRGAVDYTPELAVADADGSRTNAAAIAALAAQGMVLVRSTLVDTPLTVTGARLKPGRVVDHSFEVQGSYATAVGHGPRGWGASGASLQARALSREAAQYAAAEAAAQALRQGVDPGAPIAGMTLEEHVRRSSATVRMARDALDEEAELALDLGKPHAADRHAIARVIDRRDAAAEREWMSTPGGSSSMGRRSPNAFGPSSSPPQHHHHSSHQTVRGAGGTLSLDEARALAAEEADRGAREDRQEAVNAAMSSQFSSQLAAPGSIGSARDMDSRARRLLDEKAHSLVLPSADRGTTPLTYDLVPLLPDPNLVHAPGSTAMHVASWLGLPNLDPRSPDVLLGIGHVVWALHERDLDRRALATAFARRAARRELDFLRRAGLVKRPTSSASTLRGSSRASANKPSSAKPKASAGLIGRLLSLRDRFRARGRGNGEDGSSNNLPAIQDQKDEEDEEEELQPDEAERALEVEKVLQFFATAHQRAFVRPSDLQGRGLQKIISTKGVNRGLYESDKLKERAGTIPRWNLAAQKTGAAVPPTQQAHESHTANLAPGRKALPPKRDGAAVSEMELTYVAGDMAKEEITKVRRAAGEVTDEERLELLRKAREAAKREKERKEAADLRKLLQTPFERETGCPGAQPMALDITVTVTFRGEFAGRSNPEYVPARIQVGLYREAFVPGVERVLVAAASGHDATFEQVPDDSHQSMHPPPHSDGAGAAIAGALNVHNAQEEEEDVSAGIAMGRRRAARGVTADSAANFDHPDDPDQVYPPRTSNLRSTSPPLGDTVGDYPRTGQQHVPGRGWLAPMVAPPGARAGDLEVYDDRYDVEEIEEMESAPPDAMDHIVAESGAPPPRRLLKFDGPIGVPPIEPPAPVLRRMHRPAGPFEWVSPEQARAEAQDWAARGPSVSMLEPLDEGDEELVDDDMFEDFDQEGNTDSGESKEDDSEDDELESLSKPKKLDDEEEREAGTAATPRKRVVEEDESPSKAVAPRGDTEQGGGRVEYDPDSKPSALQIQQQFDVERKMREMDGDHVEEEHVEAVPLTREEEAEEDEVLRMLGQLGAEGSMGSSVAMTEEGRAWYRGPDVDVSGADFGGVQVDGSRLTKLRGRSIAAEQLPPLARPLPRPKGVPMDQVVATMRTPVGVALHRECRPNTSQTVGRIVMRHSPISVPVMPGKYVVSVKGLTEGTYSVSVTCRLAYAARDVVEGTVIGVEEKRKRLPQCRAELADIETSYRLGARKRHLVRDLIGKTEDALTRNAIHAQRLRDGLRKGTVIRADVGSDYDSEEDDERVRLELEDDESDYSDSDESELAESDEDEDEEEEEEDDEFGDVSPEERARLKIAAENRRYRRPLDVTDRVRDKVARRLLKLEDRFGKLSRSLTSRTEELRQTEEGLLALREVRAERQAELSQILAYIREHQRYVPLAASALRGDPGGSSARTRARRSSIEQKLGTVRDIAERVYHGASSDEEDMESDDEEKERKADALVLSVLRDDTGKPKRRELPKRLGAGLVCPLPCVASSAPMPEPHDLEYVRLGPRLLRFLEDWANEAVVNPLETPAEKVRRKRRSELTYEEGLWLAMDQILNPELHAGVSQDDDAEDEEMSDLMMLVDPEEDGGGKGIFGERPRSVAKRIIARAGAVGAARPGTPAAVARATVSESNGKAEDGETVGPETHHTSLEGATSGGDGRSGLGGPKTDGGNRPRTPGWLAAGGQKATDDDGQGIERRAPDAGPRDGVVAPSSGPATAADAAVEAYRKKTDEDRQVSDMFGTVGIGDKGGPSPAQAGADARATPHKEVKRELDALGQAMAGGRGIGLDANDDMKRPSNLVGLRDRPLAEITGGPLPPCSYSRAELMRILNVPVVQLNELEREIRSLLRKYHDHRRPEDVEATEAGAVLPKRKAPLSAEERALAKLGRVRPPEEEKKEKKDGSDLDSDEDEDEDALGADGRPLTSKRLEVRRERQRQADRRVVVAGLAFHGTSPDYGRLFASVPIPRHAPRKLRDLLTVKAAVLQSQWKAYVERKGEAPGGPSKRFGGRKGHGDQLVEAFSDIDHRARAVLSELDRANACTQTTMDSWVLHGAEQRFPTSVLRDELEAELDRVLLTMVFEREHVEAALRNEEKELREETAKQRAESERKKLDKAREEAVRVMREEEKVRRDKVQAELRRAAGDVDLREDEKASQDALRAAISRAKLERAKLAGGDTDELLAAANKGRGQEALDLETLETKLAQEFEDADYEPGALDPVAEVGGLAKWGAPDKPITPRRAKDLKATAARRKAAEKTRKARGGPGGNVVQGKLDSISQRRRALAAKVLGEYGAEEEVDEDGARVKLAPWEPHENPENLKRRLKEVDRELARVRMLPEEIEWAQVPLLLSHLRGGPERVLVDDAIAELATEGQDLKNRLRLIEIDRELHFAHQSKGEYVTTSSLHGFPQQVWRKDAITALSRDANRIIARQVAVGLVDDILEWMLEGWYFGERTSDLAVAGFVPSLRADAPLRPFEGMSNAARLYNLQGASARAAARDAARGLVPLRGDLRGNLRAAQTLRAMDPEGRLFPEAYAALLAPDPAEDDVREAEGGQMVVYNRQNAGGNFSGGGGAQVLPNASGIPGGDGRVPLQGRWAALQSTVDARDAVRRAVEEYRGVDAIMDETEGTLKYAMFLLTLVYFRALSRLRKQRDLWSGERNAQFRAGVDRKDGRTRERLRMQRAEDAHKLRSEAMQRAELAAQRGFARRVQLAASERARELQKRAKAAKEQRESSDAALRIQSVYRGHRARVATYEWAIARQRQIMDSKLRNNAAIAIQTVFRGYMARRIAEEKRKELVAFVRMIRKEEERLLEEEYYAQNRMRRLQRDAVAFFRARSAAAQLADQRKGRPLDVAGDERDEDDETEATGAFIPVLRLGKDPSFWGLQHKAFKVGGKHRSNLATKRGGYYQDILEHLLVKERERTGPSEVEKELGIGPKGKKE